MLHYTFMFLVIALVAGILGFGVIAGTAAFVAQGLFVLFIFIFLASCLRCRRIG